MNGSRFFVLETAKETFEIPQGATGADQLLAAFQGLPGFNNEAVIEAMACTGNREFELWRSQSM